MTANSRPKLDGRARRRARRQLGMARSGPYYEALEALWMSDRAATRLRQRILALQHRLHLAADRRAWLLYLAIEEAVNQRHAHLLQLAQALWCPRDRRPHGTR
jgi:hypothetical protein